MKHKRRTPVLDLTESPETATVSHSEIAFCDHCGAIAVSYRQNHDKHRCSHWPNCAWELQPKKR